MGIAKLTETNTAAAGDKLALGSAAQGDDRKISITYFLTSISTLFTSITPTSYIKVAAVTVANLPSAATVGAGARATVSDATATTFASTVAGGGANIVPVYSDGTNWKIG